MRKLSTIQKRENLNTVAAVDEPGIGGASHLYAIHANPQEGDARLMGTISFQNGPRHIETSTDGVIDTDLLEIVRDRLKGFQTGQYATEYNAKALEHIEEALMWMNRRVEDRIERNVLGTNNK